MNKMLPSFYGFWGWLIVLVILIFKSGEYVDFSILTIIIYVLTVLVYGASNLYHSKSSNYIENIKKNRLNKFVWVLLVLIGVGGEWSYVNEIALQFSTGFSDVSINDAESMRLNSGEIENIGLQVSYLGWFALIVLLASVAKNGIILNTALAISIASLVYIDFLFSNRMRLVLMLFLFGYQFFRKISAFVMVGSGLAAALIFIGNGMATGKISDSDQALENVAAYAVGGVVYFNDVLEGIIPTEQGYIRTISYIPKALGKIGVIEKINPKDNLDFYSFKNGFTTNVSSFYYNFYADFGVAGIFLGLVLYGLCFDVLWLKLDSYKSSVTWPLQGMLCFIAGFSFFSDLTSSFAFLTMVLITLICLLIERYCGSRC